MSDTHWSWKGARWWKFDFHTHTPASNDYGKGPLQVDLNQRSAKDWLLDFMKAGVDCVAVTDHNTGDWIDPLKKALAELESERPDGFRPLFLFPGVEISVHGGIHVLAIFERDKTSADIAALLGAVGFNGTRGSSDEVTSKTFAEVVKEIESHDAIAIPAHVDGPNGIFTIQQGATLNQSLESPSVFVMEMLDPFKPKPRAYSEKGLSWTEVLGSDSHHPLGDPGQRFPGSHFTWVKMGTPCLEGLRLALLDGSLSVLRSDQTSGDPNQHPALAIESVEVEKARYMGRAQTFTVTLNPWLNAIIGGRGTGKSTLVEFLRIALSREGEIPESLKQDLGKYREVYANRDHPGLLTRETRIVVTYRKDQSRFRVQWNSSRDRPAIQEEKKDGWHEAPGEVSSLFPVRLYSQKQIYHMAGAPLALLRIVDESPDVDRRSWEGRWKEEMGRFLSLRAQARELESGLSEKARLQGELADVNRRFKVFEQAGHADVLKALQLRRRQQNAVETWEQSWEGAAERMRRLAEDIVPEPLDPTVFDGSREEDAALLAEVEKTRKQMEMIRNTFEAAATETDNTLAAWRQARDTSAWKQAAEKALDAYEELRRRLESEGAGDPTRYGELVQRGQAIERTLKDMEGRRKQVEELRKQADESLDRLLTLRRELTEARKRFLGTVLADNRFVRIEVRPYGAKEMVEAEFRKLIQREDGRFDKDIGTPDGKEGFLSGLYKEATEPESIERELFEIKREVRIIASGGSDPARLRDRRFADHLQRLPPEALDRLDAWFPEDSLEVEYSPTGDGLAFRPIQEGSPGQKTAALLAFLLSYGEGPLVLDQPEDDLDNRLIYDLIVRQLREAKHRRQVIVVTHNANIVVNGDAEMVVALAARNGETHQECAGCLQERVVRDTICAVMEGGREAFEQRYRRIALERCHA